MNQEEFKSLKVQAPQINEVICQLSVAHNWHQGSTAAYNACKLCSSVERFYKAEQEEEMPVNQQTDFGIEAENPTQFIPV